MQGKKGTKGNRFTITLPEYFDNEIKRIAYEKNMSKSQAIMFAIDCYLREDKKNKEIAIVSK